MGKAMSDKQSDEVAPFKAYVRGFGNHIGSTLYETAELAMRDASLGERIYLIKHIWTVLPETRQEKP
jgi:hypothetical protein